LPEIPNKPEIRNQIPKFKDLRPETLISKLKLPNPDLIAQNLNPELLSSEP
jgi:hypothetical protein